MNTKEKIMNTLAGLWMVGSILFIIAAFTPISMQVFPQSDPNKRIGFIKNNRRGWLIANILFGTGALLAAAGAALFDLSALELSDQLVVRVSFGLSAVTILIGVVLWLNLTIKRVRLTPEEVFGANSSSQWGFPVYSLLTQAALILLGYGLAQTGYPAWLGWGLTGLSLLLTAGFLILKDMPPFVYYVLLLIAGIVVTQQG